jgi:hypothetical protein
LRAARFDQYNFDKVLNFFDVGDVTVHLVPVFQDADHCPGERLGPRTALSISHRPSGGIDGVFDSLTIEGDDDSVTLDDSIDTHCKDLTFT